MREGEREGERGTWLSSPFWSFLSWDLGSSTSSLWLACLACSLRVATPASQGCCGDGGVSVLYYHSPLRLRASHQGGPFCLRGPKAQLLCISVSCLFVSFLLFRVWSSHNYTSVWADVSLLQSALGRVICCFCCSKASHDTAHSRHTIHTEQVEAISLAAPAPLASGTPICPSEVAFYVFSKGYVSRSFCGPEESQPGQSQLAGNTLP